jgi:hypothetical protein
VLITSPDVRRQLQKLNHRRVPKNAPPSNETLIMCTAPVFSTAPTCDALARTYVDAVRPTDPFRIVVNQPANAKGHCLTDYDSRGSPAAIDGGT